MNIKLLTVITILSLYIIFGFEKISYSLNKVSQDDISELKILKYLPKEHKTFFISNSKSEQIINHIRKNYQTKGKDNLILIKNSILAYLGIDLGTNKLQDIYDNELLINTFDNKEKGIEDILLIFKINEKKDIDDVLNLTNRIDSPNKLIKISRDNKLNYLNYIYRTNDNYILTSSSKTLILDSLKSSNIIQNKEAKHTFSKELLNNFKSENNILFTKNFEAYKLLNNENFSQSKDDYIATLFNFEDEKVILKSYLINNKKNLNYKLYERFIKENPLDNQNYQIFSFNDFLNSINNTKLNSFEKAFFKELNDKFKQNILLLVSENNWVTIFEKNEIPLINTNLFEDFKEYSLENNNIIYKIYSKNILKKEENTVKEYNYNNIFSAESDKLTFLSNSLMSETDINLISKEFFKLQGKSYPKYFLNKQIHLKNPYSTNFQNIFYLENINYFLKNVINLSLIEFKAIIKQSIPNRTPIFYSKTNLKIF